MPPSVQKLADIGCAQGHMSLWLAQNIKNINVLGLDISKEQIAICRRLQKENNIPNIDFLEIDLTTPYLSSLPFVGALYCLLIVLNLYGNLFVSEKT